MNSRKEVEANRHHIANSTRRRMRDVRAAFERLAGVARLIAETMMDELKEIRSANGRVFFRRCCIN